MFVDVVLILTSKSLTSKHLPRLTNPTTRISPTHATLPIPHRINAPPGLSLGLTHRSRIRLIVLFFLPQSSPLHGVCRVEPPLFFLQTSPDELIGPLGQERPRASEVLHPASSAFVGDIAGGGKFLQFT
ncbi:Cytochrome P450 monooxygenase mpaDE [Fusarium oxysporum f. sp. albedinis]|nr:Cytochrome P450 monooxygenase mpaDE [Fusarium oxysporum f. sp. albedinis]